MRPLRVPAAVALLAIWGGVAGCGPIEYINQVSTRAVSALAAAKKVGADQYAPYEYTAAEAYLHKAREEGAYAQYQDAIEYGRRAEELADRARAISVTRMNQPEGAPASPGPVSPSRATPPSPSSPSSPSSVPRPEEDEGARPKLPETE